MPTILRHASCLAPFAGALLLALSLDGCATPRQTLIEPVFASERPTDFSELMRAHADRRTVEKLMLGGLDSIPPAAQARVWRGLDSPDGYRPTTVEEDQGASWGNRARRLRSRTELDEACEELGTEFAQPIQMVWSRHPSATIAFMARQETRIAFFDSKQRLVAVFPEVFPGEREQPAGR